MLSHKVGYKQGFLHKERNYANVHYYQTICAVKFPSSALEKLQRKKSMIIKQNVFGHD